MKSLGRWFIPVFLIGVVVRPAIADIDTNERIFSMPVSEIEEVITPWLEANGFELFRAAETGVSVRLEAETSSRQWMISLSPHSPLATRVQIQSLRGDNERLLKDFWAQLDGYVKMPNSQGGTIKPVVPNVVRHQLNAVVCIYAEQKGAPVQLSGVAIDRSGLILSTAHDLKQEQVVSVQFRNEGEMNGRIIKLDARHDLCLIQVHGPLENVVSLKEGRFAPDRGEILYAMDCPADGVKSIQNGTLDGPPRQVDGLLLWQVRMHVDAGNSGGPIFDERGRLMGVIKGRFRGTNAIGFVIPFETLLHFLEIY